MNDDLPPGFVLMLCRAVQAILDKPRVFKAGPDAFARAVGLTDDECDAVLHLLVQSGCAQVRRRGGVTVLPACLREMLAALRRLVTGHA